MAPNVAHKSEIEIDDRAVGVSTTAFSISLYPYSEVTADGSRMASNNMEFNFRVASLEVGSLL
jgi:hypothetical protein